MTVGTVLLATRSEGKLRELRPLFAAAGLAVEDLAGAGIAVTDAETLVEAFDTFEENALAKARYFRALTGGAVIADDSGLEVTVLGGKPGVHSRRWSGRTDLSGQALDDANSARLVEAVRGHDRPAARYVCAAAYVDASGEVVVRGETSGVIARSARGTGGFGYDPWFLSDDLGETFGEASVAAKAQVSHRGRAFRALLSRLVSER